MRVEVGLADDGRHVEFGHECPAHGGMFVPTRLPLGPEGWTVTRMDPLDVSPSIRCEGCGLHGFVRQGRWVSA